MQILREFIRHLLSEAYRGKRLGDTMDRWAYNDVFKSRVPKAQQDVINKKFADSADLKPFSKSQAAYDEAYGELYKIVDDLLDADDEARRADQKERDKVVNLGTHREIRKDPAAYAKKMKDELDDLMTLFGKGKEEKPSVEKPKGKPNLRIVK